MPRENSTKIGRGRPRKDGDVSQMIAFRFPRHLLERLDQYSEMLMDAHPGMIVSRSEVVRMALEQVLEQHGLPQPGSARRRRKAAPSPATGNGQAAKEETS